MRRLDSVLFELDIKPHDISAFVFDVQGAEYSAILGAGRYLEFCKYIETEVSQQEFYEGAPLFKELDFLLTQLNFEKPFKAIPNHGEVIYIKSNLINTLTMLRKGK